MKLIVLFGDFREQIVPVSVPDNVEVIADIDPAQSVPAKYFVFVSEFVRPLRVVGFDRLEYPCSVCIKYHLESELNPALEPTLVLSVWFLGNRKCHGVSLSFLAERIHQFVNHLCPVVQQRVVVSTAPYGTVRWNHVPSEQKIVHHRFRIHSHFC